MRSEPARSLDAVNWRAPSALVSKTQRNAGAAAALVYLSSILVFVASGLVALEVASDVDAAVLGRDIPATATCLRVDRKADFLVALVAVGVPMVQYRLLIRLDKIADGPYETVIFAEKLLHSETIRCDQTGACVDLTLVQRGGPRSRFVPATTSVAFVSAYAASPEGAPLGTRRRTLPLDQPQLLRDRDALLLVGGGAGGAGRASAAPPRTGC